MKKFKKFIPTLLGSFLALPSLFVKSNFSVSASDEGKDMSKIYTWKYSDGNFVEIDDWYYSGKGFSFEFKLKNPNDIKETNLVLKSGDAKLTHIQNLDSSGTTNNGGYRPHNFQKTKVAGDIGLYVDLGNGWYRYELMLADMYPFYLAGSNKHAKVNAISYEWASETNYYNDLYMKNMKVIDHYSEEAWTFDGNKSTNYNFMYKTPSTTPGSNGGLGEVENWKNSGKGFSIEFLDEREKHEIVYKLNFLAPSGTFTGDLTYNTYMLRNGGTLNKTDPGKLYSLGNNWYRYEVMFEDITAISEKESNSLNAIAFQWIGAGYGASKYRNLKIIDGYTYTVTYHVNGITTSEDISGTFVLPQDPALENHHFVAWYLDENFTTKYEYSAKLTANLDLFAKFADGATHIFNNVIDQSLIVDTATCSHGNIYYKSCECGEHSNETFDDGQLNKDIHLSTHENVRIITNATCDANGEAAFEIVCDHCLKVIESTNMIINKIGHKYYEYSWKLNDDKTSGLLTLACEHDESHFISVNARVSKETIEATTTKEGKNIYTLTASYEGKNYSRVIEESIDKLPEIVPEVQPEKEDKSGYGGLIIASSALVSATLLLCLVVVIKKRKDI